MRQKKAITPAVSLMMLSTLVLAGCGGKEEPGSNPGTPTPVHQKSEPAELVFYTNNGDSEESFNLRFGDSIRKKFPEHTIKFISSANKGPTLADLIASGQQIDIFFQSIGNFESWVLDTGIQYDMSELIQKHQIDMNRFEPTIVDALRQAAGGKIYGLPVFNNNMVLYYNKDIFDKFGVAYPKDGMTWDETLEIAKKLTRSEGGKQYQGFTTSPIHLIRMNPYSLGTADLKTDTPLINKDEKWKRLYQTLFIDPANDEGYRAGLAQLTWPSNVNEFMKTQTSAMFAYLSSYYMISPTELRAMNWDMVSLPTFKDAPNIGSQAYPSYFGVTAMSKYKDQAMDVLNYMTSDEAQTELARKGIIPVVTNDAVRKSLGQDSEFKSKNLQAIFRNKFAPIPPKAPYDSNLVTLYGKYVLEMERGTIDINTAFRKVEEESVKAIAEYKSRTK
ncbi:extracellular solute-binding protein [Paenibacillus sp. GYB004]|uniref:ABC transporter substrate-binding protein n=1 Tax=Paenibacillus sp. GYB004 TaxID=2994393 RepID=UPI002F96D48B